MSLHTNHRLLLSVSAIIFLFLTLFIAVLPAFEAEKTKPLAAIEARTKTEQLGHEIYLIEGCGTCHTQFVRDLDVDKPYGRGSVAGDYALEDPPLLGTQRTGPDLSNVGKRQPSEVWNLIHLYNPRIVVPTSVMPGYPWYFREVTEVRDNHVVVPVPDHYKSKGKTVVAKEGAIHLVRYLQSLQQAELD